MMGLWYYPAGRRLPLSGTGPALVGSVLMRKPIAKVVPLRFQPGSP